MPNLAAELEIGEQLCQLARELPAGAKAAEALSLQATRLMEAAGMGEGKTALIGRFLGTDSKLAAFAGRPTGLAAAEGSNAEAVFYGPGRNLYSLENGGLRIVRPTPSGQALRVEEFAANSGSPSAVSYLRDGLVDRVGTLHGRSPDFSLSTQVADMRLSGAEPYLSQTAEGGLRLPVHVRTTAGAREFMIGTHADGSAASRLNNFPPASDVIDSIRGAQPLKGQQFHFSHPFISQHYGLEVGTPLAKDGRLVGFDSRTGEALVNFDRSAVRFEPGAEIVKPDALELGRYHLGLDGTKQTIMRDTLGRVYGVETAYSPYFGYRLNPVHDIFAFSPSELRLPDNRTLAHALSIPETAGTRALGGYDTLLGGGLHIGL